MDGEITDHLGHELTRKGVPAYARFKAAPAAAVNDLDLYTDDKDPVADLVVIVVEQWATVTRWSPGEDDRRRSSLP